MIELTGLSQVDHFKDWHIHRRPPSLQIWIRTKDSRCLPSTLGACVVIVVLISVGFCVDFFVVTTSGLKKIWNLTWAHIHKDKINIETHITHDFQQYLHDLVYKTCKFFCKQLMYIYHYLCRTSASEKDQLHK